MNTRNSFLFVLLSVIITSGFSVCGTSHAEETRITSQGIQFSDGTLQTTKAVQTSTSAFGVYDGNNLFIGYLIDEETVFRSDISAFFQIDTSSEPPRLTFKTPNASYRLERYWKSADCTGTTYGFVGAPDYRPNPFWLNRFSTLEMGYFLLSQEAQKVDINEMKSREVWDGDVWGAPTGQCESYAGSDEGSVFEFREISFPLEGVSLVYPLNIK